MVTTVVVVVVETVSELDHSMVQEGPPTHSPVLVWQFERYCVRSAARSSEATAAQPGRASSAAKAKADG